MAHMGLQELSALRTVTFIDSDAAEKRSPAHRERVITVFKSLPFRSEGRGTPASFIGPSCDSDDTTVATVFQVCRKVFKKSPIPRSLNKSPVTSKREVLLVLTSHLYREVCGDGIVVPITRRPAINGLPSISHSSRFDVYWTFTEYSLNIH